MVDFRPKFEAVSNDHPEFNLVLSKKQNYDMVRVDNGSV
jgi:ubiquitin carboxyl-terminal hydrolase 7